MRYIICRLKVANLDKLIHKCNIVLTIESVGCKSRSMNVEFDKKVVRKRVYPLP